MYRAYATTAFSSRTESAYAATVRPAVLAICTAPPAVCAFIVITALVTDRSSSGSFSAQSRQNPELAFELSFSLVAAEGFHRCRGQESQSKSKKGKAIICGL